METTLVVFFEKIIVYAGKILRWPKFGHFWPKLTILKILAFNFQTPLWIFLIFGMEVVLMMLFEKIILYMLGKVWYGKLLVIGQNLAIFWPKLKVWEFLTYNIQTPLWIFLFFGMEVLLMVFFEKVILYMQGKFWYGEFLAI